MATPVVSPAAAMLTHRALSMGAWEVLPTAGHQAEQGLGIRETNVLILAYYVGDIGKLSHSSEFQLLHLQNGNKNIDIRECNKEWMR